MNLVMNNKLKLLYITFFIFSCIALFFVNSFYKAISHIEPDHKYTISAPQYYNYKANALNKIIDKTINKPFKIKNIVIESESLTLDDIKTSIKFDLQLDDFINESELELRINEVYIGSVKEIVDDFNSNRNLYDYEYLNKLYEKKAYENNKQAQKDIKIQYNRLMTSRLYELYPPKIKCSSIDEKLCLNKYRRYYTEFTW